MMSRLIDMYINNTHFMIFWTHFGHILDTIWRLYPLSETATLLICIADSLLAK